MFPEVKLSFGAKAVALMGAFGVFFFGAFDDLMVYMLMATIIDFIVGVTVNMLNYTGSMKKCGEGIAKKVLMYLVIALANMLDKYSGLNIPIRETILVFYATQETISILDNVGKKIKYPRKLRDMLATWNKEESYSE